MIPFPEGVTKRKVIAVCYLVRHPKRRKFEGRFTLSGLDSEEAVVEGEKDSFRDSRGLNEIQAATLSFRSSFPCQTNSLTQIRLVEMFSRGITDKMVLSQTQATSSQDIRALGVSSCQVIYRNIRDHLIGS